MTFRDPISFSAKNVPAQQLGSIFSSLFKGKSIQSRVDHQLAAGNSSKVLSAAAPDEVINHDASDRLADPVHTLTDSIFPDDTCKFFLGILAAVGI